MREKYLCGQINYLQLITNYDRWLDPISSEARCPSEGDDNDKWPASVFEI